MQAGALVGRGLAGLEVLNLPTKVHIPNATNPTVHVIQFPRLSRLPVWLIPLPSLLNPTTIHPTLPSRIATHITFGALQW